MTAIRNIGRVTYRCAHVHVSGRQCTRRTITQKTRCSLCKQQQGTEYCSECLSMLAAFRMPVQ